MTHKRGEHPNSLKNLEKGRFRKGQSGNPRGRPRKELCISSLLREKLGEPCPKEPSMTWADWLALRGLELAGENAAYYKELLDRLEGKVTLPVKQEMDTHIKFVIGRGYVKDEPDKQVLETERTLPAGDETPQRKQTVKTKEIDKTTPNVTPS